MLSGAQKVDIDLEEKRVLGSFRLHRRNHNMNKVNLKGYIGVGTAPAEYQIARIFEVLEAQAERIADLETICNAQLKELERMRGECGVDGGGAWAAAKNIQRHRATDALTSLFNHYNWDEGNSFCTELQAAIDRPIPTAARGKTTEEKLEKLDLLLLGTPVMSFSMIGKRLDLGKNRRSKMTKLRPVLEAMPDRYIIESGVGNSKRVRLTVSWRRYLEFKEVKGTS